MTRDELIDGYRDGQSDDRNEYPVQSNRSDLYRHGWLNGRDDRIGAPRKSAASIRADYNAVAASPLAPEGGRE